MPRRGRGAAARADDELEDDPAGAPTKNQRKERMTLFLSRTVRRRLRVMAAVMDRDMSEVIEEALERYIDTYERQRAARGLPPLPTE
ncbi:MAG: hypothetical protein JO352_05060 [Chloroflexi bacterium]|nr:hypothetical protein [Chloroflexota bacterium]MBV9598793.1 hypothetical protein [Chloroflexota bacterium]